MMMEFRGGRCSIFFLSFYPVILHDIGQPYIESDFPYLFYCYTMTIGGVGETKYSFIGP